MREGRLSNAAPGAALFIIAGVDSIFYSIAIASDPNASAMSCPQHAGDGLL